MDHSTPRIGWMDADFDFDSKIDMSASGICRRTRSGSGIQSAAHDISSPLRDFMFLKSEIAFLLRTRIFRIENVPILQVSEQAVVRAGGVHRRVGALPRRELSGDGAGQPGADREHQEGGPARDDRDGGTSQGREEDRLEVTFAQLAAQLPGHCWTQQCFFPSADYCTTPAVRPPARSSSNEAPFSSKLIRISSDRE